MKSHLPHAGRHVPNRPRPRNAALWTALACWLIGASGIGGSRPLAAQPVPHLTGTVSVELTSGSIEGDVCLARVPVAGDTAVVVLNEALEVRDVTGANSPAVAVVTEPGGGTVRHAFTGVGSRIDPASGATVGDLCVRYGGRVPTFDVASQRYRGDDASNVIAFNGSTLRARGASRWYPTPFASRLGIAIEALSFQIEIACGRCERIYINGGMPVEQDRAVFSSTSPRELLLVAGSLPFFEFADGAVLGEFADPDSTALFLASLRGIREFLEDYVGVPYGPAPVVVRLDAVRRPRRGAIWGFYSDPALTLIGMRIPEFVRILNGAPTSSRRSIIGFLGHELAHRYFGWSVGSGSSQRDMYGEPFATYLELKTIRHFLGEEEYLKSVTRLRDRVARGGPRPALPVATPDDLADSSYRYAYVPLALLALESAVGEPTMRRTLELLVTDSPERRYTANFEYLVETAGRAGASTAQLDHWAEVCLAGGTVSGNTCMSGLGR